MPDKKKSTKPTPRPTIITLTLTPPTDDGVPSDPVNATLFIQRGDLAHIRRFTYLNVSDIATTIKDAYIALAAIEAEPPVLPEAPKAASKPAPKTKARAKAVSEPDGEEEPTIDISLKKGSRAVKVSHLQIVGGETDAAAYRQAALIAGKLIDGKLWDGSSPIRIDDVYATMKKMQHLTERELSLFTLDDFVQVGDAADAQETPEDIQHAVGEVAEESTAQPHPVTERASDSEETIEIDGQHSGDAAHE